MLPRTCCTFMSHSHLQPPLKSIKFSLTWHLHLSTGHLRAWSYSIMASSLPSRPLFLKVHCTVVSSSTIHYIFMMAFLSTKMASLPETSHMRQWHHFELICRAITAYKDYVMALGEGEQYYFAEDIWPVGGGEMNVII